MSGAVYQAYPIKRPRRTKAEIRALKDTMMEILRVEHPMTVRQMFYRLESRGIIEKDEKSYNNIVCRLLGILREEGELPFEWISDNTRWMRIPRLYNSAEDALMDTARTYRRDLWQCADAYVEVWCEKNALAGVLREATWPWHVPLMANVGFGSKTFLHAAAQNIHAIGKPAYIYYFGDHDPHGRHAGKDTEKKLRKYSQGHEIHFEWVAVTEEQIQQWNLATRPTKKSSCSKKWTGPSVDLDAIPSKRLITLAENCILRHLDMNQVEAIRRTEAMERESLMNLARIWNADEEDNDE